MRKRACALLTLAFVGSAAPALAQGFGFGLGVHDVVVRAGHGAAPLDGLTAPTVAYSFRKLRSAYTGPAVRLVRADNSAELDIGFLGFTGFTGAPWNQAAAVSHCSGTNCYLMAMYDQSGNGRNAVQSPGARPLLVFNCNGTLPCTESAGAGFLLSSASVSWISTITSASVVAKRKTGTGACYFVGKSTNYLYADTVNVWTATDFTSTSYSATAADAAWHTGIVVFGNLVTSIARIDAAETTGAALLGTAAAGSVSFNLSTASTTCDESEAIVWDGYALTATERAILATNQHNFWGF